ncbi:MULTISPECIES: membrane integrity lipid transport subunit YebS [Brenneria]|uniref:Paraquat-inducible protein A n=1 Tax=Brenneria nigrifluens DSM 30175 = ATCC 13028 TaxID=1121120 RepID=A0A2U1USR8_9GAMM|nr:MULTISPECIES: membrane integrity lipid transport subunit YebS [Brenneria]EHD21747.1 integral membrane protein, PqiA family [Brenneria sp. EniD312]PWC24718.1 paraquat-inducible protein A [Brenneria nigrifluens DSM 30175 = ATCC 13028]QCR04858.1 paraquat-inducible protein A [Brenneria nigrifluens DSM 30175 = ATCC 13028]
MKIVNITSPAPFPSARPPYADGAGMPAGKAARYHRCPECDAFFSLPIVKRNQTANCPRCNARVSSGRDWSISRLAAMAVAMLVLMPFAYTEPLISIRLLGVSINASLFEGIWQMTRQGHPITASMVAFCTVGAPLTLVFSLLYLFFAPRIGMNLRPILLMLGKLKEWMMLDIYLVGMAVAAIKVREFADVQPGGGLIAYLVLMTLSVLTIIHLNADQLWQRFYPRLRPIISPQRYRICLACHFTSAPDNRGRCPRCHVPLRLRRRHSLQKSWAALIASVVLLLPANLLPISIIYVNGVRTEDTIFSGILSLASGNIPVALVVFIASILVPFTKVIVLCGLLLSIHLRIEDGLLARMKMLRIMRWIGRWSMLDLFVIALTMSLVNRDQLLAFTMGPAAFYFGAAVILTILAVEWLDSRLMWDNDARQNT